MKYSISLKSFILKQGRGIQLKLIKYVLFILMSIWLMFEWNENVIANTIVTSSSNVYVDGKKIVYSVEPILKDGTTLVPLRETFEAMGASVVWDPIERKVTAKNGNREVILIINSNSAYKDKQSVTLATPAIIYQSKTMIPLRFVGEAFDGKVNYDLTTKDIHITMPKFITDFLPVETAILNNIKNVEGTKMTGSRRLMVSDNPEILNQHTIRFANATLWNDIVVENTNAKNHRVFAWHINKLPEKVVLGITIENRSKTNVLKIKNGKGVHKKSQNTWYEYDIGLPIAESLLSDRLQKITLLKDEILPGETIQLGNYLMNVNDALGILNDFTVEKTSGTGSMNYVIRTVISSMEDYDITKIKSKPVPLDTKNMHSRGVWPSSDITVTIPKYKVGETEEITYNISNGHSDDLLTANKSLVDPLNSISNKGHFGVVYKVKIPYINVTNQEKVIQIRIGSRGGEYSGTIRTKYGVYNVPTIQALKDVAIVLTEKVKPCKCSKYIELNIVHSGGATLPIAINVRTLE